MNSPVELCPDLPSCPVCMTSPVLVEYEFKVKMRGRTVRERRAYHHCACGECVTDWCRPVYEKGRCIAKAREVSAEKWKNKEFVK